MQPDQSESYHYNVIERAIKEIDAAGDAQLSLDALASRMGMSTAHFQKVFSHWVGVSPKRYQQYLVLGHAKTLLKERFTTLETANSTGLSSTGRLHDLFLRWEAMSPGEYANQGAGLTIYWDWIDTPFGPSLVMATTVGICGMAFLGTAARDDVYTDMAKRWPKASFKQDNDVVVTQARAILEVSGEATLHMIGAPFQIKVWEALLQIPSGHVSTYSEIAQSIGNPKAVRAVGTAVGRNPVSWLIPCHRALRKSGALGGYHWGLDVKRAMLAWESARAEA